jgi:ubiquinone/menaquinone biosynthesis C-methylase UbiE
MSISALLQKDETMWGGIGEMSAAAPPSPIATVAPRVAAQNEPAANTMRPEASQTATQAEPSPAAAEPPAAQPPAGAQSAPPEAVVMQLALGSLVSQAVYVAAKLGVADLLAAGPQDAAALATATGTHAPALYRILRALASFGVFAERADGRFELTPAAEALRADAPNSVRDAAIFMGEDWHWRVWGSTLHSVRTGQPAWAHVHGAEVFPYFAANPEAAAIFDRAMTSMSAQVAAAVIEAYDFAGIERLVDVAGGHGRLLMTILRANPTMKGVLFDLEHVIERARGGIEAEGMAARCELATGDFFAAVPAGADAYIMKHIIHDWDDERALVILQNIRRAMRPGGRVLIVESVVAAGSGFDYAKVLDIEMLTSPGGQERTAEEYRALCARAGLRVTRIVPTKSPFSVIEAVPTDERG